MTVVDWTIEPSRWACDAVHDDARRELRQLQEAAVLHRQVLDGLRRNREGPLAARRLDLRRFTLDRHRLRRAADLDREDARPRPAGRG